MKLFHGSILKKLVVIVLLATTPVFLLFFITELVNRQNTVETAKKDFASYLNGFVEVQRRITDSTRTLLRTVASMPDIRNGDVVKARVILATLLEANPIYANAIFVDLAGNVLAAGKNHAQAGRFNFLASKQFKDALTSKGFVPGEFTVGKSSQEAVFPYGIAVLDNDGEPRGVIMIGVRLSHYGELFERGTYPLNTFFGLCDHEGLRLYRFPRSDKIMIGVPVKLEVFRAASTSGAPGSVLAQASDGVRRVIVFEPIRLLDGKNPYMYMFMGIDYGQIQAQADAILKRLAVTSFISLTLALIIAWFFGSRGVVRPVEKLSLMTRKFGHGDVNVASAIDYSDGEIGNLAESIDNMVVMLHQRENERNEALEKLRLSEQRFREIIEDVSAISVQGYDENREVIFWNHASEKLYGYTEKEASGKKLENLIIPPEMKDEVVRLHTQWLEKGIKIPSAELTLVNKHGSDVHVFSSHVMHETKIGKEMFCIDIDLMPIMNVEAEKEHLLDQLGHSQKMDAVGQLAGGIAHDFNNMLGGIIGASEMLSLYLPDDPKAKKFHQIILQSANRAADLTGKLLAFSRDTSKASSAVMVHNIIKETVILLENTMDRRISIKVNLDAESSIVVGDPSQLQNVFLNLAINGSHAMPEGGMIEISSQLVDLDELFCCESTFDLQQGKYLRIEIRDNGCGIPPEHLTKIFEPFFTTKDQGKGTGLGLAAAYGTIKQHHGSITAYSEVGTGTLFHILLPLANDEKVVSTDILAMQRGDGTILLVDDEEVMRITAKAILEDLGYDVIFAENGQKAVAIYQQESQSIDLVILDMVMPVMNGKDCFIALQRHDPTVRALLSSGFTRESDLEEMKTLGLKGFIRKPYRSTSLSQAVYDALH